MYVLSLQPTNFSQICIAGDVEIDERASIAPGAILQATPGSRLIVAAGACIGMGAVVNAYGGTLRIEAGANLGAAALVVGCGSIGAHACIGAAATILDPAVNPGEMIAPGTILGDRSRQVSIEEIPAEPASSPTREESPTPPEPPKTETERDRAPEAAEVPEAQQQQQSPEMPMPEPEEESEFSGERVSIYGQTYVQQLMVTLFPHKKDPPNGQ